MDTSYIHPKFELCDDDRSSQHRVGLQLHWLSSQVEARNFLTEWARGGDLERKGLHGLRNGKGKCDDALAKPLGFSEWETKRKRCHAFMLNISYPMTGIMAMDNCSWLRWAERADTNVPSRIGANMGVLSLHFPLLLIFPARSTRLELNEMKWTQGLTKALSIFEVPF